MKNSTSLKSTQKLSRFLSINSLTILVLIFLFKISDVRAFNLPNALVISKAVSFNSKIFVLGKNGTAYCFQENSGTELENLNLSNVNGFLVHHDTLFAWNNKNIYWLAANKLWTKFKIDDTISKIIGVSHLDNQIAVVYSDRVFTLSNKKTIRTPKTMKQCFGGQTLLLVSFLNDIYELGADKIFVPKGKIDSALQIVRQNDALYYRTPTALKKFTINNQNTALICNLQKTDEMVDMVNNILYINKQNKLVKIDDQLNQKIVLSNYCKNINFLNEETVVYNDALGSCFQLNLASNNSVGLGANKKAYGIIQLFNSSSNEITAFSKEGFIINSNNSNEQLFNDFSVSLNTINDVVKVNNNFLLATDNGLFLYNSDSNNCTQITNQACTGVANRGKYIFICSNNFGVVRLKMKNALEKNVSLETINKGLIIPSAYVIKSFGDKVFCVSKTGVYKLNNSNNFWSEINESGFVPKISTVNYYTQNYKQVLFIASEMRGIVKTNNNGLNYESLNWGLNDTIIANVLADSNGFYILTKNGKVFYHHHDGTHWTSVGLFKKDINSVYLENGYLTCIDNENNINELITYNLKPAFKLNGFRVDSAYSLGDKILVNFELLGLYGANNHTVLQITKENTTFNESFVAYSDFDRGVLELELKEDLIKQPGYYTIRVVSTEPYITTKSNRYTILVK